MYSKFAIKIANMAVLSRKQKQELAKELYLKTDNTQKAICEKVGCSTRSFNLWKKKGSWEDLKISYTISKEQELRRIYIQIREINNAIADREEGKRFATTKEADILAKLAGAAKNLESETSTAEVIDVFIGFNKFLMKHDFNKAKEIAEFQDVYIKFRLSHS